ncbi:MAG: DUF4197 domain-containing protein [Deltaproteobacteria bacterium]|nr:DUF4197 domain-containing protein [Deltaproteobacteria bacterium]
MKKIFISAFLAAGLFLAPQAQAVSFDDILKGVQIPAGSSRDDGTTVSGLKEALSVGTDRAVKSVSKTDGYFKDQAIKILMPEKIQKAADVMKMAGYSKEVDDFVLSMNRAAEKAAPEAAAIFVDAIKQMSFEDAGKILNGGNTAATEYFKTKTSPRLFDRFKPIVSTSMNEVGVTRSYKAMTEKYTSAAPFMKMESLDLDRYVTNKALEGLFFKLGQEEMAIRTNPAARTMELLRKVFAR